MIICPQRASTAFLPSFLTPLRSILLYSYVTRKFHFTAWCFEHPSSYLHNTHVLDPVRVNGQLMKTGPFSWDYDEEEQKKKEHCKHNLGDAFLSLPTRIYSIQFKPVFFLLLFLNDVCVCCNLFRRPGKTYTQAAQHNNSTILKNCRS